jgi:hypothetical protein
VCVVCTLQATTLRENQPQFQKCRIFGYAIIAPGFLFLEHSGKEYSYVASCTPGTFVHGPYFAFCAAFSKSVFTFHVNGMPRIGNRKPVTMKRVTQRNTLIVPVPRSNMEVMGEMFILIYGPHNVTRAFSCRGGWSYRRTSISRCNVSRNSHCASRQRQRRVTMHVHMYIMQ